MTRRLVELVQAEAEVRHCISQHRIAEMELRSSTGVLSRKQAPYISFGMVHLGDAIKGLAPWVHFTTPVCQAEVESWSVPLVMALVGSLDHLDYIGLGRGILSWYG